MVVTPPAQADRRLCTLADNSLSNPDSNTFHAMPQLRAEVGTYIINYYVQDIAAHCADQTVSRTVNVQDTLAPVLTLKYRGHVLSTDATTQNHHRVATAPVSNPDKFLGSNPNDYTAHKNPAYYKVGQYEKHANFHQNIGTANYGNPQFSLMAQAASTNGWLIAAVASGIAGVALFSVSVKKSNNCPVPV